MGLGLVLVKLHGFLVDVEPGGGVPGDIDDAPAWVDLVLAEITVTGSNNHLKEISFVSV